MMLFSKQNFKTSSDSCVPKPSHMIILGMLAARGLVKGSNTCWIQYKHVALILCTNTVSLSVLFFTSAHSASHPALSFRSAIMYSHFPGPRALRREDVSLSSDSLREAMKTREPFWMKAWAAISPRPVAPPVMRTTSPLELKSLETVRSSFAAWCVMVDVSDKDGRLGIG